MHPHPEAPIAYRASFSREEFDVIRRGLEPQQMEDKWHIQMQGKWLELARSWTGLRIYRLRFAERDGQYHVVEALINDDRDAFRRGTDEFEIALLDFLICRLMLHQDVPFPLPSDMNAPEDVFQHHIAGTGYCTRRVGRE